MENILKIRCSSLGAIMTNARSKQEILGDTAKKCIEDIFDENELGITHHFSSRYTEKGTRVEVDGINLCNEIYPDFGFMYKNSERFSNDYITGEPDVINDKVLIDIKSSFTASTFPFHEKRPMKKLNKNYYYQLQGYMWLTGKTTSYIAYCLSDTPEDILQDEIRKEHWNKRKIDEDQEVIDFVNKLHKPSLNEKLPKHKRVKLFEVKFDEKEIEAIMERIEVCREYYEEIKKEFWKEKTLAL